jgi:hypothetical protein
MGYSASNCQRAMLGTAKTTTSSHLLPVKTRTSYIRAARSPDLPRRLQCKSIANSPAQPGNVIYGRRPAGKEKPERELKKKKRATTQLQAGGSSATAFLDALGPPSPVITELPRTAISAASCPQIEHSPFLSASILRVVIQLHTVLCCAGGEEKRDMG